MGRPTKYSGESLRLQRKFRIRKSVDDKLVAAARDSGRSISEEIEKRIAHSFEHGTIIDLMMEQNRLLLDIVSLKRDGIVSDALEQTIVKSLQIT